MDTVYQIFMADCQRNSLVELVTVEYILLLTFHDGYFFRYKAAFVRRTKVGDLWVITSFSSGDYPQVVLTTTCGGF